MVFITYLRQLFPAILLTLAPIALSAHGGPKVIDLTQGLPKKSAKSSSEQDNESMPSPDMVAIRATLVDYIEGSTNGQPDRLKQAFHPDLNLYSVRNKKLRIWAGVDYIKSTKQGVSTGEKGTILSIDLENDIAVAKVEISPPKGSPFVDYFMLLKLGTDWKIVHKMYTRRNGKAERFELKPTLKNPEPDKNLHRNQNRQQLSFDSMDDVAAEMMSQQHLPGLSVVVVENGKTTFKRGYGFANVEQRILVDPDRSLFRIGSVSKALTFLVLTRLIDQGKLQRTDPVRNFVKGITNPRGFNTLVTVDDLLQHTGGFDQIGVRRQIREHHLDLDQRKARRVGLVPFLEANNLRRVSDAGEMFRYDTYGVTLAGAIIEKITGKPFADAMKQELFEPLGMKNSFVEISRGRFSELAIGYGWQNGRFQRRPYEVYETTPASSIDMTPADMGLLMEALQRGSQRPGSAVSNPP